MASIDFAISELTASFEGDGIDRIAGLCPLQGKSAAACASVDSAIECDRAGCTEITPS